MTKKELREAYFKACKMAMRKEEKPDVMEVVQCANVFAQVIATYPASECKKELGAEVYDLVKRCTKVLKREVKVEVSKLLNEIDYYENEDEA